MRLNKKTNVHLQYQIEVLWLALCRDNHKGYGKHSNQYADDHVIGQCLTKNQSTDKNSRYWLKHPQYRSLRSPDVTGSYGKCGCRNYGGQNGKLMLLRHVYLCLERFLQVYFLRFTMNSAKHRISIQER